MTENMGIKSGEPLITEIFEASSGFDRIDETINGFFQPSNMYVIASRSGYGKTTLALNIANYIVSSNERKVLFFSLETSNEQLLSKIFSLKDVRSCNLSQFKCELPELPSKVINELNFFIDDNPYLTVSKLRNECQKVDTELKRHNKKLDAIFIDYLQLMHLEQDNIDGLNRKIIDRQDEIAEIAKSIKALSMEMRIPIIVTSQLKCIDENDIKPKMKDLVESSSFGDIADVVLLIDREDSIDDVGLTIVKNRTDGDLGSFPVCVLNGGLDENC